jgi:hypothetical protein
LIAIPWTKPLAETGTATIRVVSNTTTTPKINNKRLFTILSFCKIDLVLIDQGQRILFTPSTIKSNGKTYTSNKISQEYITFSLH